MTTHPHAAAAAAHLVDPGTVETLDVLGATAQFLMAPGDDTAPFAFRGTIPAGWVVPLHAHPDPETFVVLSGAVEALVDGSRWIELAPGEVFHVPPGAPHAWRNPGRRDTVQLVVTTPRIGRFFREIGTPIEPGTTARAGAPSPEAVARFLRVAERYGYWNATPEENAAVGIRLT